MPGQWGDAPQLIPVLERVRVARAGGGHPRTRPDHLGGDKAYSSRRNCRYLRRRHIKHTIPGAEGPAGQPPAPRQQGRSAHQLRQDALQTPQQVERAINLLNDFRALATRHDKRAYVFHGTVTLAAIRLWLRARSAGHALVSVQGGVDGSRATAKRFAFDSSAHRTGAK